MRDAMAALRQRGATFFRFSVRPMTGQITVEGWRVPPPIDGQGEPPL